MTEISEITSNQIQAFDREKAKKRICQFIERIFEESGQEEIVVGISGGVDSSLTTQLLVEAVGPEKVTGFFLPDEVTPERDAQDVQTLARELGIKFKKIRIDDIVTSFLRKLNGSAMGKKTKGNIKVRTRTLILYAFSNELNGLVPGSSDRSEWLLGYFTKWGDGAADFFPIRGLYKTQVRALGRYLGLPSSIVEKPSSPALWKGQTAKGELGVSYETIDKVFYGFFDLGISRENLPKATGASREIVDEILQRFKKTKHKRTRPPSPKLSCLREEQVPC